MSLKLDVRLHATSIQHEHPIWYPSNSVTFIWLAQCESELGCCACKLGLEGTLTTYAVTLKSVLGSFWLLNQIRMKFLVLHARWISRLRFHNPKEPTQSISGYLCLWASLDGGYSAVSDKSDFFFFFDRAVHISPDSNLPQDKSILACRMFLHAQELPVEDLILLISKLRQKFSFSCDNIEIENYPVWKLQKQMHKLPIENVSPMLGHNCASCMNT